MERIIGIRVSPSKVYYSIIEKNDEGFEICDVSEICVPKMLDIPNQLTYIRTNLLSIITEYDVCVAGMRLAEEISDNKSTFRINLEGVIQEVFVNSTIKSFYCGGISAVSSVLKEHTKIIKEYFDGKKIFMEIENWDNEYSKEERESIVISYAAIVNGGDYIG